MCVCVCDIAAAAALVTASRFSIAYAMAVEEVGERESSERGFLERKLGLLLLLLLPIHHLLLLFFSPLPYLRRRRYRGL